MLKIPELLLLETVPLLSDPPLETVTASTSSLLISSVLNLLFLSPFFFFWVVLCSEVPFYFC